MDSPISNDSCYVPSGGGGEGDGDVAISELLNEVSLNHYITGYNHPTVLFATSWMEAV